MKNEKSNSYSREKAVLTAYWKHSDASIHITKAQFAADRFEPVDFKMISGNTWCAMEAKVRINTNSSYPTYFLEKKKYDALKVYYDKGNVLPLYLNYFNDGTCLIWNLTDYFNGKEKLVWRQVLLPEKTSTIEFPNGKAKIYKLVADLPVSQVTYRYNFQLNFGI